MCILTRVQGLIWTGAALAIVCCTLRFVVRIRSFKRLLIDDYFVLFALILVVTTAIIWQVFAEHMYYVMVVSAGVELPGPGFPSLAENYFKASFVVVVLFYSALWSIKLSFLLFFKRLGKNVRGQAVLWWPILGITIATYCACIGTIHFPCLLNSFEYLAINCSTASANRFSQVTLKLNCTWDVTTDALSRSMTPCHGYADDSQSCVFLSVCLKEFR